MSKEENEEKKKKLNWRKKKMEESQETELKLQEKETKRVQIKLCKKFYGKKNSNHFNSKQIYFFFHTLHSTVKHT